MRTNVRERSRSAVAVAGMRERRAPVESAGTWREARGQSPAPFRPGKTARRRKGGRS